MAYIEKRTTSKGEIRYRVQITLKGHPRISETFSTRRAAERWAERTTEAIRQRRFKPDSEAEKHTVGDLLDRYIKERIPLLARGARNEPTLEWWRSELGNDTRLSQVTPEAIAAARDRLAAGEGLSGKVPSPGTIKRYLTLLGGAMTAATKDWFWLDINPCAMVRRPKQPRGRVRCLDAEERIRLLAACRASSTPQLYPLFVTALFTGARRGELLNLEWQDVDLERGIAILHHTKNGERRALAITGMAKDVLSEWYEVRRHGCDLVFPSLRGKPKFPQRAWEKALIEAEIEDFRWHDLRHTFASYLAMSGATLAELAEALGHKTLGMVKRYAHLTEGHTARVISRMAEKFLPPPHGSKAGEKQEAPAPRPIGDRISLLEEDRARRVAA